MNITERIFQIIEEKNLKTADLAKKLNIHQSVISNWRKRKTTPPLEYALVICEFLGTSIEYLITGKESDALTPEEKRLIEDYRAADERGKRNIIRTADDEANEIRQQEESSSCRTG